VGIPKDRKQTYSDRQSQSARAKKQAKQPRKKTAPEDSSQAAVRIVKQTKEG
jgi:hypothetical protein